MKHEPDASKKVKTEHHEALEKDQSGKGHANSPGEIKQKVYYRDPHLGHAAGDYEPLEHKDMLHTSDDQKHKTAAFKERSKAAATEEVRVDESLELLLNEDWHAYDIDQIHSFSNEIQKTDHH